MTNENTDTCKWTYDDADWQTGCGQEWMLLSGTPEDNSMRFCPMCGRLIAEDIYNKVPGAPTRPSNPPLCPHGKTMHDECIQCNRGRTVA